MDIYMKTMLPSPSGDTWDTEYKRGGLETDFQVWPIPSLFPDLSSTGGGRLRIDVLNGAPWMWVLGNPMTIFSLRGGWGGGR